MIDGGEGSRYQTTSPLISQVNTQFTVYAMDTVARNEYIQLKTSLRVSHKGLSDPIPEALAEVFSSAEGSWWGCSESLATACAAGG
jgi:hypothetical protein